MIGNWNDFQSVKISSKGQMMPKIFLKMSLQVTRRGFTVTKPNNNPHTGRVLLRLAPGKPQQARSRVKATLLVFLDHQDIVHYEFAPEGQTLNQDLYLEVLRRLRDAVGRKRPETWTARSWLLHHDSAPAHAALSIRQFLTKHSIPTIPQPPYLPNLSPPDLFLFFKLKIFVEGRRFWTVEDIITNATKDLKVKPQTSLEQRFRT
jgi:hypothetical protein